jgi:hypothetical protein
VKAAPSAMVRRLALPSPFGSLKTMRSLLQIPTSGRVIEVSRARHSRVVAMAT